MTIDERALAEALIELRLATPVGTFPELSMLAAAIKTYRLHAAPVGVTEEEVERGAKMVMNVMTGKVWSHSTVSEMGLATRAARAALTAARELEGK